MQLVTKHGLSREPNDSAYIAAPLGDGIRGVSQVRRSELRSQQSHRIAGLQLGMRRVNHFKFHIQVVLPTVEEQVFEEVRASMLAAIGRQRHDEPQNHALADGYLLYVAHCGLAMAKYCQKACEDARPVNAGHSHIEGFGGTFLGVSRLFWQFSFFQFSFQFLSSFHTHLRIQKAVMTQLLMTRLLS